MKTAPIISLVFLFGIVLALTCNIVIASATVLCTCLTMLSTATMMYLMNLNINLSVIGSSTHSEEESAFVMVLTAFSSQYFVILAMDFRNSMYNGRKMKM